MAIDDFRPHHVQWSPVLFSVPQYQSARSFPTKYLAQADAAKRGLLISFGRQAKISAAAAVAALPSLQALVSPTETFPIQSMGEISLAEVRRDLQKYGFRSVGHLQISLALGQYPKTNIAGRHHISLNCLQVQSEKRHFWRLRGELDCFLLRYIIWELMAAQRLAEVFPDENEALMVPSYLSAALTYFEELRTAKERAAVYDFPEATTALMEVYRQHYKAWQWLVSKAHVWRHDSITAYLPHGHVLSIHENSQIPDFAGGSDGA